MLPALELLQLMFFYLICTLKLLAKMVFIHCVFVSKTLHRSLHKFYSIVRARIELMMTIPEMLKLLVNREA